MLDVRMCHGPPLRSCGVRPWLLVNKGLTLTFSIHPSGVQRTFHASFTKEVYPNCISSRSSLPVFQHLVFNNSESQPLLDRGRLDSSHHLLGSCFPACTRWDLSPQKASVLKSLCKSPHDTRSSWPYLIPNVAAHLYWWQPG